MPDRRPCVYVLASGRLGTLYMGVTADLERRLWEHRSGENKGFSKRYGVKTLVYYEVYDDINTAIEREKQIKKFRRKWKIHLIEGMNPDWRDLSKDLGFYLP